MKYFLRLPGRKYTHAKDFYFNGKINDFLTKYGFVAIGNGDNAREFGKWAQNLSLMTEYEKK